MYYMNYWILLDEEHIKMQLSDYAHVIFSCIRLYQCCEITRGKQEPTYMFWMQIHVHHIPVSEKSRS